MGAGEYLETREHYEVCASNKIREITAWLERRARRRNGSQKEEAEGEAEAEKKSILTVCNAVRQLLYDCGNELGWCFTEDQVSEARFKQKASLEELLSKYYSTESLRMCFVEGSLSFTAPVDAEPSKSSEESQENKTIPRVSVNDRRPKFFPPPLEKSASWNHPASSIIQHILISSIVLIF